MLKAYCIVQLRTIRLSSKVTKLYPLSVKRQKRLLTQILNNEAPNLGTAITTHLVLIVRLISEAKGLILDWVSTAHIK